MPSIAGVMCFHGATVCPSASATMLSTAAARQLDPLVQWSDKSVSLAGKARYAGELAHRKAVVWRDTGTGLALAFDGRLDDRDSLRKILRVESDRYGYVTDPELVLEAYRLWGRQCAERLNGDFAFCLWDSPRKRLYCARDRMGARPLCYVAAEGFFAFASSAEGLLGCPGISGEPNPELLAYYLVPEFADLDQSRSWYDGISVLPPASSMTIDIAGKVSIRRYWRLEPMGFAAYQSVEECSEAFLEVFGRAVDRRTRGRGSIAQMLSGGLDSAAIGVVASRALRNDKQAALETYSVVCDDMESSLESRCIVELVRSLGVRPCYVKVPSLNGSPGLSDLRDIAWNSPHPVDNELLIPAILSRAAARGGHELMLNGMAGDLTLFTPMYYQAWYISQGRLLTAWRECLGASRNNTIVNGIAPAALLWRSLRTALVPGSLRLLRSRTRSRRELRLRLDESLIRNELIEKYRLFDRIVEVEQRRAGQRKPELDRQILEAMFGAHGIGSGLTAYDRVARREGIELADPWADRDVVEFFAKVPLQFRVNRGWAKFLVRETFRDEMPAAVRRRKDKEHLGWMMTRRLMLESADIVGFLASSPQGVIDSYLDYAKVIARLKRHEGTNDETEWLLVFRLATVIMWIDQSRKKASAKWSIQ